MRIRRWRARFLVQAKALLGCFGWGKGEAVIRRIQLGALPFWRRWLMRLGGARCVDSTMDFEPPAEADHRLLQRVELEHVRAFVEGIETYWPQGRAVVHVVSSYRMPAHEGLASQVPWWLARRLRFAVADELGGHRYLGIRGIELIWDETWTELFLRLDEPVEVGMRAFVAAYMGDGPAPESIIVPSSSSRAESDEA